MAQPRPALRALFRRTQPCAKGGEHEVLLLYRTDRRHWDLPGCRDRYDESISAYANFLQGVHDDCGSTSVRAVPNLTAVATQQTHPHLTDVWSRAYPKLRLPLGLVDAEAQSKRQRLKLNESTVGYLLEGAYEDWNSWRPRPTSSRKPHVQGFAWVRLSDVLVAVRTGQPLPNTALLSPADAASINANLCGDAKRVFTATEGFPHVRTPTPMADFDQLYAVKWVESYAQKTIDPNHLKARAFPASHANPYIKTNLSASTAPQFETARNAIQTKAIFDPDESVLHNLVASATDDSPPPYLHALPYLAIAYARQGELYANDAEEMLERYVREVMANRHVSRYDPIVFLAGARLEAIPRKGMTVDHKMSYGLLRCFDALHAQAKEWYDDSDRDALREGRRQAEANMHNDLAAVELKQQEQNALKGAHKQWDDLKRTSRNSANPHECKPLDELMERWIGLETVKQNALELYLQAKEYAGLPENARVDMALNFVFMGNPGTGKTTVARKFGEILHAIGVRGANKEKVEVTLTLDGDGRSFAKGAKVVQGSNTGTVTKATKRSKTVTALVTKGTLTDGATTTIDNFPITVKACTSRTLESKPLFIETGPTKLMSEGPGAFETLIEEALGGVLFIDEAYALEPKTKPQGQGIFDLLMLAAENHKKDLTIILAGYKDDIENKLYSYNVGLKRRFPNEITFEDFSETELRQIWLLELAKTKTEGSAGWEVATDDNGEDKVSDVAARRLARGIGRKGFGNAGDVRTMFQTAVKTAISRGLQANPSLHFPDLRISIVDVIGHDPSNRKNIPLLDEALTELEQYTGLDKVKDAIRKLVEVASINYQRELEGKQINEFPLNRLFLGNPGTGKTTIAKLYGKILKALGYLSDGTVEVKVFSDFMGAAVGESAKKTTAILQNCEGKVLVIDEAYALDDDLYGKQAIDTIVALVNPNAGSDMAVIMAGYEKPMLKMIRDQNAGLSRRFNPQHALYFDDFPDSALHLIIKRECFRDNVKLPIDVRRAAIKLLSQQRCLPNFGNAGALKNMLGEAKKNADDRMAQAGGLSLGPVTLTLSDFGLGEEKDPFESLNKLFNIEHVIKHLKELQTEAEFLRHNNVPPTPLTNYLFLGNSGTGKTTVANAMAAVFYRMGMLPTDRCVVVSAPSLFGTAVGQAQEIVEKTMESARGGVLLIDEAYELGKQGYGEQAQTKLVAMLEEDEYKDGQIVVILAGYETDIMRMVALNQGMRSRFPSRLSFPDWESEDCFKVCASLAESKNILLSEDNAPVKAAVIAAFDDIKGLGNFGNARTAKNFYNRLQRAYTYRVSDEGQFEARPEFAEADVIAAKEAILNEPRPVTVVQQPDLLRRFADLLGDGLSMNMNAAHRHRQAPRENHRSAENQAQDCQSEENERENEDGGGQNHANNTISHPPTEAPIIANLEQALGELNLLMEYQTVHDMLETENYPEDLMKKLRKLMPGQSDEEIREALRGQAGAIKKRLKDQIEEDKRLKVALRQLEEEERQIQEEKEEAERQRRAAIAAKNAQLQREAQERINALKRREAQAAAAREAERQRQMAMICPYCGLADCGWSSVRVPMFF